MRQDRYSCMEFDFSTCDRPWGSVPLIFSALIARGRLLKEQFPIQNGKQDGIWPFSLFFYEGKRCNFKHIKQRHWITQQGVIKRDGKVLPACLGGQVWLWKVNTWFIFAPRACKARFCGFLPLFYGNLEFPSPDEQQGKQILQRMRSKEQRFLVLKRQEVRTWSSWAAKRGKKGDYTEVVHTWGMTMAKSFSKGQYKRGEGTGWWKGMRKSKQRQSWEVLLITKEEKSILSIPEMWKDSHRELKMEKYHEPKPDSSRDIWQVMVPSCAACIALLCSAVSKPWDIRGERKKDKCQSLPFAYVGWESRRLGKQSVLNWWLSL